MQLYTVMWRPEGSTEWQTVDTDLSVAAAAEVMLIGAMTEGGDWRKVPQD